jgi:hypothetical protein
VATSSSLAAILNSNESKNKMSTKAEIIEYFKANPEAKPIMVGKMFGAANGNVYNYRKEALGIPKKTRKLKKFNIIDTIDIKDMPGLNQEALSELAYNLAQGRSIPAPPHRNAWDTFGEWMTTSQYEGYLRGIIIEALTSNRDGLLPEVEDAIKRLRSITGE